ncbi:hypothetical protein AJ80_02099 [Polytolypa hystricis UAMH7299]|uniref:glutathione-specific gamma-glutamylcyclotransferase n=1 Tax=Polytolypa hystricis (strain UAMH7299) TaxID=1447883 RepID=A0A2B7YS22_POLH7|nr:hypothetical protein AJ80_02099 [Polytolypa hystricis UAMH7299]
MTASTEEASTSHTSTATDRSWRDHFPDGDLWVFGYGGDHRGIPESPGRVVTVIERAFWETLDDPQKDIEPLAPTSAVWGAAYHIPASHAEEVHAYLDHREIDGYTVHYTPFHPYTPDGPNNASFPPSTTSPSPPQFQQQHQGQQQPTPMTCMVYIGLPSNPQFLSQPSLRDPSSVAQVISISCGASGENKEYLYLLEKALEGLGLGSADGHVSDLVKRVQALETGDVGERRKSEVRIERRVSVEELRPESPDEFEVGEGHN